MKFKVGDTVRVRSDLIVGKSYANEGNKRENAVFVTSMEKYSGKIAKIKSLYGNCRYHLDIDKDCWFWTDEMLEAVSTSKIVITTDGNETLARLYEGNKVIKSATAKCSPDDKFDAIVGARIAFDRLIAEATKREYKVGQIYRVDGTLAKAHGNIKITEVNGKKISFNVISGMRGWVIRNFDIGSEFDGWCTLIEEKEEEPKIKVGDKVVVIDKGKSYSRYVPWFERNAPAFLGYFSFGHSPDNETCGVVKHIAPHDEEYNSNTLYAIEVSGSKIHLIGEKGIKKVEG